VQAFCTWVKQEVAALDWTQVHRTGGSHVQVLNAATVRPAANEVRILRSRRPLMRSASENESPVAMSA